MGNCCPPKDAPQQAATAAPKKQDAPRDMEYMLFGISLIVKTGDTTKETADGLVTGLDNNARNRSNSQFSPAIVQQLNGLVEKERGNQANPAPLVNGEIVVTTGSANLKNVTTVFHLSVPVWRGGQFQEITTLEDSFEKVLEIASEKSLVSIIFSDIGSNLFGIPKQLSAQALFRSIKKYASAYNDKPNKIKQIKFIHRDPRTVSLFEEIIKEELGIKGDRAETTYVDILQGSKTYDEANDPMKVYQMEDQNNLKEKLLQINRETVSSVSAQN